MLHIVRSLKDAASKRVSLQRKAADSSVVHPELAADLVEAFIPATKAEWQKGPDEHPRCIFTCVDSWLSQESCYISTVICGASCETVDAIMRGQKRTLLGGATVMSSPQTTQHGRVNPRLQLQGTQADIDAALPIISSKAKQTLKGIEVLTITYQQRGTILGPKGERLKALKGATGAKISMLGHKDGLGTKVRISGDRHAVQRAKTFILRMLDPEHDDHGKTERC
eukprot:2561896-Amphidinium_carterae.1